MRSHKRESLGLVLGSDGLDGDGTPRALNRIKDRDSRAATVARASQKNGVGFDDYGVCRHQRPPFERAHEN
jgi:hypothetical protein